MQPIFMAASEIVFTETDEGFFVEGFLISDKINQNGWMVTQEANQKDGHEWKGRPDIFFIKDGRLDHTTGDSFETSMEAQEPFRKGTMQKILGLDVGRRLTSISKIEDPDIIRRIKNKEIKWTSPAVFPRSLEDVEIVPIGPNSHIHILHRYRPLHRAFVDDPAYGRGETQLGLTCEGNSKECLVKLEQLKAGIGDDEIGPLRTIPLKVSKCSETGNLIIEMEASELSEEVSKCLSEKGGNPTDQDIAICFDEARKKLAKKANSSQIHKSYSTNQMGNEEITRKEMDEIKGQLKDISEDVKKALKAQTETEEEKKEAKKAQDEKDEKEKQAKKSKHGQDKPEDEKTAQEKEDEEKARKAQEEEDEKKMTARIASELSVKIPLVEKYVAAKTAQKTLDEKASTELREKMLKASVDEIKEKLDDIESFVGVTEQSSESKIGYMGSTEYSGNTELENKSTEELLKEAEIDV